MLSAYAKTWEKVNNICASQEMIQDKMDLVHQNHIIFAVNHLPFPNFSTGLQAQYNFTKELLIWILDRWVQPWSLSSFQCIMGICLSFLQWPYQRFHWWRFINQNQSLNLICKNYLDFLSFMKTWPISMVYSALCMAVHFFFSIFIQHFPQK